MLDRGRSRPRRLIISVTSALIVTRVPLAMLNAPETPPLIAAPVVRLGDVPHVDEVPRLLAVTVDRERQPAQHAMREDRDHVAVGVVALVDAVDVEVAQADALERVQLRVGEAELLRAKLAGAVGRVGLDRVVLANRQRLELAEDARRRGEHELADAVPARRLEDGERAEDVDLGVDAADARSTVCCRRRRRGGRRPRSPPWPRSHGLASRTSPSTSRTDGKRARLSR